MVINVLSYIVEYPTKHVDGVYNTLLSDLVASVLFKHIYILTESTKSIPSFRTINPADLLQMLFNEMYYTQIRHQYLI